MQKVVTFVDTEIISIIINHSRSSFKTVVKKSHSFVFAFTKITLFSSYNIIIPVLEKRVISLLDSNLTGRTQQFF